MALYIHFNTDLKAKAALKSFEADHFNLMNNVVFGKIIEDVEKCINVPLVRPFEGDRIRHLVANPAFISRKIFNKDLAAILSVAAILSGLYMLVCVF